MNNCIVIKKDFVSPNTKSLCQNKQLTSGKAYFLCQSTQQPIFYGYAGKECVKKYVNVDLNTIPDFTKSLIINFEKESSCKKKKGIENIEEQNSMSESAVALTYLILRQDKLRAFKGISYYVLEEYYQEYLASYKLSKKAITHILNIEKHINTSPKLKLKNLLTCYAYEYKILLALEYIHNEKQGFVLDLLEKLRTYYRLSEGQIKALGEWFKYIPYKEFSEAKIKKFTF